MSLPSGCREFASDIEGVLEMLPHREGEVLALRYGLFSGEPLSLADVAKVLKMSAEGVRKNELQAFRWGSNSLPCLQHASRNECYCCAIHLVTLEGGHWQYNCTDSTQDAAALEVNMMHSDVMHWGRIHLVYLSRLTSYALPLRLAGMHTGG